jgi:hypothetical protein
VRVDTSCLNRGRVESPGRNSLPNHFKENIMADFYGTPDEDGLTAEGIQDERYASDALDEAHALDAENYFVQDSNFDGIAEDEFGLPVSAHEDEDELDDNGLDLYGVDPTQRTEMDAAEAEYERIELEGHYRWSEGPFIF